MNKGRGRAALLRRSALAPVSRAAKEKSSGSCGFRAIGFEQICNDAQNMLLPVAGQLVHFFKHAAGFSNRPTAAFRGVFPAHQIIQRDV
jgi:hypothetical protein